jgi:D-sedoheptulose 7-phosphate isomerase
MRFPSKRIHSIDTFFDAYTEELRRAAATVSREKLIAAESIISAAIDRGANIFVSGNGGSAAISNHLACDHAKGIQTDTSLRPRVQSLAANVELITAVANDISYDDVFAFQMATSAQPGDLLITISSSGNSENIVRAIQWAREHAVKTIAMTGFNGGRSAQLSDVNLHVESGNYGIVEDIHQSLMHTLAQFIRQSHMPEELILARKF